MYTCFLVCSLLFSVTTSAPSIVDLMKSSPNIKPYCTDCRPVCCLLLECSRQDCPECHEKTPACDTSCPCTVKSGTGIDDLSSTWTKDSLNINEDDIHKPFSVTKQEENKQMPCGDKSCGLSCSKNQLCANTGESCESFPCCSTVACISF
ncbi:uncharacterized protein LOC111705431 [Eurytemora carolleeae]|uniref:uncharacterized protein LOC111705431 n=1 Tax=Eurytemora carolleeae TaxID=1294199 RepID=UPI000C785382|nr:uncharacterized protein LOC111705431 [Eurytemora carolleeae]|eukprot:XP_023333756.1 uncharacterized protein LOC111705431 [Eurytemora affinis]